MPSPSRARENVVDAVADAIALRILRGELAPGARLDSVRNLAAEHGVNVSTIQRVLARLEQSGIVRAHARSGVEIRDPARHGGAGLWPLMLRHAEEQRERAIALLRDGFATRRLLAAEVFAGLLAAPRERYADALHAAIERFGVVVETSRDDHQALAESENEIVRTALVAAQRPAVLAVYNDIADMLFASEAVLAALYGAPELHLSGWRTFEELLRHGGRPELYARIEPLLRANDERVVAAYAASLGLRTEPTSSTRESRSPRATSRRKKS